MSTIELTYHIRFVTAGSYNVWLRLKIIDRASDSIFVGLDDLDKLHLNEMSSRDNGKWIWMKIGQIAGIKLGLHDLNLWAREDGIGVDRIYLTTGGETPSNLGSEASPRDAGTPNKADDFRANK